MLVASSILIQVMLYQSSIKYMLIALILYIIRVILPILINIYILLYYCTLNVDCICQIKRKKRSHITIFI